MIGRGLWSAVLVVIVCGTIGFHEVAADPCGGPDFAFGNAGYAAGYSIAGVRGIGAGCGWPAGGGCGPCLPVGCRPCWRSPCWGGGWRVGGWPDCSGFRYGWPRFGGWCGSRRWRCHESIFLSVPACGGGTFFSGGTVPFVGGWGPCAGGWPMNWYPGYVAGPWGWYPHAVPAPVGVGPQFGPAGILPFLGAAGRGGGVGAGAAGGTARAATVARVAPAARPVNAAARRRAERLVAAGDRHLRAARAGRPAQARAAADAYRRAASAAPDDPDIRVREALALVALGDLNGVDAALARAIAIDGRLAAAPPRRGDLPPDPVFGDRPADAPAPLAARGAALLHEIGGADAADVEWLAARWSDRWGAAAAVASR